MTEKASDRPECPKCGSEHVLPIAYGLPGPEMMEDVRRGEIELGGCVISGNDPQWSCQACGWRWGKED